MIVGAVDIGGTKIAVGLIDEQGTLLAKKTMETLPREGLCTAVERIIVALTKLQREAGIKMHGIGVACTGRIDPLTGELSASNFLPGWEGIGLVHGLANNFNLPIAMENDADAAALAECRWGTGQGRKVFIYLTVSTGIGAGLLLDGRLYRGVDGGHPEMGHHTIDPSGPLCGCGSYGCWEAFASGPAMASWYGSHLACAKANRPGVDAHYICDLSRTGDRLAQKAVDREAQYLGIGMANLTTLFAPECIALGGGVMKSWDLFEPTVRQIIKNQSRLIPSEKTRIALARIGEDVTLIGAGQVWFHRYSTH
ncbi:MAG: ROK family protein [Anaerolineaceae bacterium]|nr:ROK family protein [Anaerolineaceae bacterium]